jgi:E3 ubiquitin-protein ligase SHPRH
VNTPTAHENSARRLHPLWFPWTQPPVDGGGADVPSDHGDLYWSPFTGSLSSKPFYAPEQTRIGILADEMGLGKTLEIISLIASNQLTSPVITPPLTISGMKADGAVLDLKRISNDEGLIRSRATLVVTPISIINQWIGEIRTHAPSLTVCVFDGTKNENSPSLLQLAVADVVLVTYHTLAKETNFMLAASKYMLRHEKMYVNPVSPLLKVNWWRVVLDEAQEVESTVKLCAIMASKLPCINRWCCTGTPIGKNGLDDLGGLFTFLKHNPFESDYLWRVGVRIPYTTGSSTHPKLAKLCEWKGLNPLMKCLKPIFWRHSKSHVAADLNLPPLHQLQIQLKLSPIEDEFYRGLLDKLVAKVTRLQVENSLTLSAIETDLVTLRKALCHPQVVKSSQHLLGDNVMPLESIMDKMTEDSLDDVQMVQRDLCSLLNRYGAALMLLDRMNLAKEALVKSWTISQDVEVSRIRYQDEVSVVKHWKLIEIQTITLLISVSERLGDSDAVVAYKERERIDVREEMYKHVEDKKKKAEDALRWVVQSLKSDDIWWNYANADKRVVKLLERRKSVGGEGRTEIMDFYSDEVAAEISTLSNAIRADEKIVAKFFTYNANVRDCISLDRLIVGLQDVTFRKRMSEVLQELLHTVKEIPAVSYTKDATSTQSALEASLFVAATVEDPAAANKPVLTLDAMLLKAKSWLNAQINRAKVFQVNTTGYVDYRVGTPGTEGSIPHPSKWNMEEFASRQSDMWNDLRVLQLMKEEMSELKDIDKFESQITEIKTTLEEAAKIPDFPADFNDAGLRKLKIDIETKERSIADKSHRHTYLKNKAALLKAANSTGPRDGDGGGSEDETLKCSVCWDDLLPAKNPILTKCGHIYCPQCMGTILKSEKSQRKCPECRQDISKQDLFQVDQSAKALSSGESDDGLKGSWGTKVEYVIKHMLKLRASKSPEKALIFSQWSPLLHLISLACKANGIKYVSLQGSTHERAHAVEKFNTDDTVTVFLLNSSTDASGLTLVSASHVFLMEPNSNPAIEEQAINRVHRMGQKRDTYVYRLIISYSIEERVLLLQEEKKSSIAPEAMAAKAERNENLLVSEVLQMLGIESNSSQIDGSSTMEPSL